MDPLQDPSYLHSVVQTIADSLYERSFTSIHNLLDAYATFVNRVRSQRRLLQTCDTLPPALAPLTVHRDRFVRALRRDVCLAHFDPFASLGGPDVLSNAKIDTKQYARDSSLLCHHALCVLTTILRFPAFQFAFPEHDLSSLFGDVLDIALADQPSLFNRAKTYSLSLWALGCHRLPSTLLDSRRDDIFSALQRSLDGARQPANVVLDGLKAVSHTMERRPSAFLDLIPLLPRVMTNLNGKSFEHHLHASIALGQFASAFVCQTELTLTKWQSLSNHITPFLESWCDGSQTALGDASFSCTVRTAFSTESHAQHIDAPARILAVLASLIVLCGPTLYRKPTVLHFILQSLAIALTHKRSIVRALHPHVWRCFVWTFSQMLSSPGDVEPESISLAFYVIKQEVSGGIGVALASVLLSDRVSSIRSGERGDRVSQVLSVVKAMVQAECKHTRRDGFMFLHALTNDSQVRNQILQDVYEMPASVLLNGAIIRAEWDNLPPTIHSIPKVPVSVHWPEGSEIVRHYKTLLVIWKHFASTADRKHLDSGLVDVWLSILFVCSHQHECGQQPIATTEMLRYAAAIIVEFLPSVALGDSQPDWGSWKVHDQLYSLAFIEQLWSAMQRAFVTFHLAEVAEIILTSILKLCASLMMTAPPSFLHDIHHLATSQLVIRSQRELWGVVASSLSSSELSFDWKELARFLAIPICTWVLSEPELRAWEALLRNAITKSEESALVIEHFISQYFQGNEIETWDSVAATLCFLLNCACEHGNSLTDGLLSTVDVCLTVCYSRTRHSPEVLAQSLQLLNAIRHAIVSAPGNVMRILQVLCNSLCLWIEDRGEVMSDDEFNSVAISLYCEALKALEVLPLSIQSLHATEDFLASAFSRIPMPAIAPFAFERFWRATYYGQGQICDNLPPKIKSCLSCFVDAYGGDLADGLSLTTESQSQSINNGSQHHCHTGHRHQGVDEFDPWVDPPSTCTEMKVALRKRQYMFTGQGDTTFLVPSPGDDEPQPTVLRQEYTSRMNSFSVDDPERSMSGPRIVLSSFFPPHDAMPWPHTPEETYSVTSYASNQKRKLADNDDASRKRSQTLRDTLRSARKLESEPATRNVTPIDVPRTNSMPPKRRKVFNGVRVPTFREVSRRKLVHGVETNEDVVDARQGFGSIPPKPSSRGTRRKSSISQSPFVESDEDDFDWENIRVDEASRNVNGSLADAYPSSLPQTQASALHNFGGLPPGSSPPKAMSQSEDSTSAPTRPSLRRAEATLSRLDALRDIYSSVTNGASQISLDELVQATRLVHQIGAALTEQMGKKMDGKMGDPA